MLWAKEAGRQDLHNLLVAFFIQQNHPLLWFAETLHREPLVGENRSMKVRPCFLPPSAIDCGGVEDQVCVSLSPFGDHGLADWFS